MLDILSGRPEKLHRIDPERERGGRMGALTLLWRPREGGRPRKRDGSYYVSSESPRSPRSSNSSRVAVLMRPFVHATESRFYNGGGGVGESQGSTSMIDVGGEISNAANALSGRMCRPGICTSAQTRCIQSLIPLAVALSSGTP